MKHIIVNLKAHFYVPDDSEISKDDLKLQAGKENLPSTVHQEIQVEELEPWYYIYKDGKPIIDGTVMPTRFTDNAIQERGLEPTETPMLDIYRTQCFVTGVGYEKARTTYKK